MGLTDDGSRALDEATRRAQDTYGVELARKSFQLKRTSPP